MTIAYQDKFSVLRGICAAGFLSLIFIGAGFWLSQTYGWFADLSREEILSLSLLSPSLSLAAGIGWAARTRHFKQNIDGSAPDSGSSLDVTLRYIRNTSEQVLLFVLMAFCLYGAAPKLAQSVLPILGVWFLVARILFWAGYVRSPLKRAVGFAATFHPTLFFLGVASFVIIKRAFTL